MTLANPKPQTNNKSPSASALEVCINADDLTSLRQLIETAISAGARRIELCGDMAAEGLTPSSEAIEIAAQTCHASSETNAELLVMIRPRAGDFNYNAQELALMCQQIETAAQLGADGVVFGVTENGTLKVNACKQLASVAKQHQLAITFHRAFDTLIKQETAITQLAEIGVTRILSNGTKWLSGAPLSSGISNLVNWLQISDTTMEFVIGGGLSLHNLAEVTTALKPYKARVSYHVYSAVLENNAISSSLVSNFVNQIFTVSEQD